MDPKEVHLIVFLRWLVPPSKNRPRFFETLYTFTSYLISTFLTVLMTYFGVN